MSQALFAELGLSPDLLKAVEKMGFEQASPIQARSIPILLSGKDLIGQSQTGSGKTAAFGIPAVEAVDAKLAEPQVLILCPTRELAMQVAAEMQKIALFKKGVRELPIYGGASYDRQFKGLRSGPQIIIGTPGRVLDHLKSGALNLKSLKMVVLDEADRMLDMGFRDDLELILENAPVRRQTVLFSATLPPAIRSMIERFTHEPERVSIEATTKTMPNIEQSYVELDFRSKPEALCRLLDLYDVKYGIIFGFTKLQVDEVTDFLNSQGYNADKLHGDLAQSLRERVMKRFRDRQIDLLVATDVAARGLDVDDLEIVINYELPHDPEDYVHRIGRTGRAGRSGKAISMVSGREWSRLQQVQRFTKTQIPRVGVPKLEDLERKHANRLVEGVRELLAAGEFPQQEALCEDLLAEQSPTAVISALLHMLSEEKGRSAEKIIEDTPKGERPARPERPDRPERQDKQPRKEGRAANDENSVWIRLNVGKNVGIRPGDIVGCIAGETGLPAEVVGAIHLMPTITLVQVADIHAEEILEAVNGARLGKTRIGASFGQPPREMPAGGQGSSRPRQGGGGGDWDARRAPKAPWHNKDSWHQKKRPRRD
jgi:ATP-dependent RNA helicase DeaD